MPRCVGLPNGKCPGNRNDKSVKLGEGDQMLCQSCDKERYMEFLATHQKPIHGVETVKVRDNHDTAPPINENTETVNGDPTLSETSANVVQPDVRCELLCFMKNKLDVLSFDDNVKITCDFYREHEIMEARAIICQLLPGKRLAKRQGNDKCQKIVEDLLKILLDPANNLPNFYVCDISRLPAVGTEHIDVSALLQEVAYLRSEVKQFLTIQMELKNMRSALDHLVAVETDRAERNDNHVVVSPNDLSPLDELSQQPAVPLLSDILRNGACKQPPTTKQQIPPKRSTTNTGKSIKPVYGASVTNKRLKSTSTKRSIDVFVSRLEPTTTEEEVVDCTYEVLEVENDASVKCVKLKTKFHGYASFHISISVDAAAMKTKIDRLMSTDAWPKGLLVRRYFPPKNHGEQQS